MMVGWKKTFFFAFFPFFKKREKLVDDGGVEKTFFFSLNKRNVSDDFFSCAAHDSVFFLFFFANVQKVSISRRLVVKFLLGHCKFRTDFSQSSNVPERRSIILLYVVVHGQAHPSIKTLLFRFVLYLKVALAHPFQERHERSETLIVLGVAKLVHQALSFLLGEFLTKIGQQPEEILAEDSFVLVLVVQFQDFNEIVDATGVLGVLGLLEDGVHLVDGDHLLALFLETTAHVVDGVVGGVQVAGADEVTNVESIDFAVTLEVVDLEGELDFFNIPRVDAVFLSYFLIRHVVVK